MCCVTMCRSRLRCCWCWEAETGGCLHTRGWSFIKHWRAEVHLSGTTGHNKLHKDNLTVWALPHWFYSYSTQSFLSFISLKSGCCGFLKMDILCPEWTHRLTASSTQRCGCTSIFDHARTHTYAQPRGRFCCFFASAWRSEKSGRNLVFDQSWES